MSLVLPRTDGEASSADVDDAGPSGAGAGAPPRSVAPSSGSVASMLTFQGRPSGPTDGEPPQLTVFHGGAPDAS